MYSHRFPLKRDIWKFRVVILCAMISTAKKKKNYKKLRISARAKLLLFKS